MKWFPQKDVGNSVHVKAKRIRRLAFECPRLQVRNRYGRRVNDILSSVGSLSFRFRFFDDSLGDMVVRLVLGGGLGLYH